MTGRVLELYSSPLLLLRQVSYPVDLTPSSIKMLEVELGESYRPSIDRLKRR